MEALILLGWAFDSLLGFGMLWLAWRALHCPDLFEAIVFFVAFGLLMALTWVRLDAPDIALAEAAIGAGLTGALLLAALSRLRSMETNEHAAEDSGDNDKELPLIRWVSTLIVLLFAIGLWQAIVSLPSQTEGLSAEVAANISASGVSNPVTAVLLNFRAYDTLLEMIVLLLALLGVWSLGGAALRPEVAAGEILDMLSRLMVPILILVAAYLLWVGAHAPGGAFQAGSLLGAAGVLLILSGWRLSARVASLPLRLILLVGPAVFTAAAWVSTMVGGRLLQYPSDQSGSIILLLETAATLSIGATLAALFLGRRPQGNKQPK